MGTRIKHVAICTENYDRMAEFYKSVFGMKKITNGMTDATGNYNPERGHISDGLIGYALLQRQPGAHPIILACATQLRISVRSKP